jgi:hypothetical protein
MSSCVWDPPRSRDVGLFTDLTLYAEALQLAQEQGTVTASYLQRELRQRLLGLLLVKQQSPRAVQDLIRELRQFGWLEPLDGSGRPLASAPHMLTEAGSKALTLSKSHPHAFHRRLAVAMHQLYVIPGWFVARLWQINSDGQGEVILPIPLPGWRPRSRGWAEWEWNNELEEQTLAVLHQAQRASTTAFPVAESDWLLAVEQAWERLSTLKPRGLQTNKTREPAARYRPRRRLTQAMREAAVGLLFGSVPYGSDKPDFSSQRPPLYPRTFMAWCPRLEVLEMIFYTDWHPQVPGRLLFPTAVFRSEAPESRFELLTQIVHANDTSLWLHQPQWEELREEFCQTLVAVHQHISARVNSLYISLLDVRDEVCRQLRLSAAKFDEFLTLALDESLYSKLPLSISVETDIREEQRSGSGLLRRPVYIRDVPHALIALARLPETERTLI